MNNRNKGKPSSDAAGVSANCFVAPPHGNVKEPFACPVDLDEERDTKPSSRPTESTNVAVEFRKNTARKPAPKASPNLAFYPSIGSSRFVQSQTVPKASVARRDEAFCKPPPPKPPPNFAVHPSIAALGSRPSYNIPNKKEKSELSFPFVVDEHPTHLHVEHMAKLSINSSTGASPSSSTPVNSRNNLTDLTDHRAGVLPRESNRQNLEYFAEIASRKNYNVSTSGLKTIRQSQIVNTPLGLAVLLNRDGSYLSTTTPDTINRDPANTMQRFATNTRNDATAVNQQYTLVAATSIPTQLGIDESRKFQRWSPEEDKLLRIAVSKEGGPPCNWKRIASKYFSNVRSSVQCKSRWTKVLKPGIVRGAWTPEEDAFILKYQREGLKWFQIAEYLPGRIGEHICDRYCNFLDPTLKKTPWTPEEDRILFEQQRRLGNKWTQIKRSIPGRSENMVKNRWHNLKVTRQRKMRHAAAMKIKSKADDRSSGSPQLRSGGDDLEQRLLERNIRFLQSKAAKNSSNLNGSTNGATKALLEQKLLAQQIQSLRLGKLKQNPASRKCPPKEVIEILDDDDD